MVTYTKSGPILDTGGATPSVYTPLAIVRGDVTPDVTLNAI